MKYYFLLFILFSGTIKAQHAIAIGSEVCSSLNRLEQRFGYGAALKYEYSLNQNSALHLMNSINVFELPSHLSDQAYLIAQAGYVRRLGSKIYVSGDLGYENDRWIDYKVNNWGPAFGFSAGIEKKLKGIQYTTASLNFKYHKLEKYDNFYHTWITLHVMYRIRLNKLKY